MKILLIMALAAFTATCSVGCTEQAVTVSGTGQGVITDERPEQLPAGEVNPTATATSAYVNGDISCPVTPPYVAGCSTTSQINCVCRAQ